ncbi:putative Canalicular multispecific organic anion transporter 1 [Glarea lozoyensis 74030]|uniref:Putative Canalicular multispecific organic anion transporter 1 n=1 Tax=Glarea lozoyensis (strain ATCC 74030 / MF5533) TaxID=1104152 RepID=H0EKJ9_GLAL7|nr:putative Canalicular multispecific organic anion transporter 1 [Glarea lozoyensis 74030]
MKHLRISGLAAPVESLIQKMRVDELKSAAKFRTIYIIVVTLGYLPMALSTVMTFAVTSEGLDVSIQTFLEQPQRVDFRMAYSQDSETGSETGSSAYADSEHDTKSAISITGGNFGWETNKIALKDINLTIPSSRLTMVVGPIASGKSTLCTVLLGEIPVSRGHVSLSSNFMSRKVGYCGQTPYLSNASIKENIIGFSPFNQARYDEAVKASMLEQDLSILPKGDDTSVGSSGISLSGGQKQRVSIARALYLDTNFFIFDDILSGLDADTEAQVFERVFGPNGILRHRNATVVLCTHSIRHLPAADHVIALGEHGTIVEQGSFSDLAANENYIQGLDIKPLEAEKRDSTQITDTKVAISASTVVATPKKVAAGFSHMDERSRLVGVSNIHRHYIASLGKTSVLAFTIFGVGWGFFYNFANIWLTFWAKDVASGTSSRSNSFYIGIYALFQVAYVASMFFCFLICFRLMIKVSGSKLHKDALKTMINAPLRFFATTDTGSHFLDTINGVATFRAFGWIQDGNILNYIVRWYTQIETSIGALLMTEGNTPSPHKLNQANPLSGKSSTILLLLRLLDPLSFTSQNITIDSLPLHKIDRSTLRQRIIAVPQDPVFLPDGTSIMVNLDPYSVSSAAECEDVLSVVGLSGLITLRGGIGEALTPASLSQGQKQLFSLARAILRRRIRSRDHEATFGTMTTSEKQSFSTSNTSGGILLLDEVSSSVDRDTDRAMQKIIMDEIK